MFVCVCIGGGERGRGSNGCLIYINIYIYPSKNLESKCYHMSGVCEICIKCNYLDLKVIFVSSSKLYSTTVQALLIWGFLSVVRLDWGASMQAVWEDVLQHGSCQATHPLCASGTGPETCLRAVYC